MKNLIRIVEASGDLSLFPVLLWRSRGPSMQNKKPRWESLGVFCPDCMAGIDPGWAQTRSVVCGLWNRRTPAERR